MALRVMCLFSVVTNCNCSDHYDTEDTSLRMSDNGPSVSKTPGNYGRSYRRTSTFRRLVENSALGLGTSCPLQIREVSGGNTCPVPEVGTVAQGNSSSHVTKPSSHVTMPANHGTMPTNHGTIPTNQTQVTSERGSKTEDPLSMMGVLRKTRKLTVTQADKPSVAKLDLRKASLNLNQRSAVAQSNWMSLADKTIPSKPKRATSLCKKYYTTCILYMLLSSRTLLFTVQ